MANATASTPISLDDSALGTERIVDRAGSTARTEPAIPDDQLLELFQKRADLKKRYAGLSDELAEAKQALADKDAALVRVRREKEALERALGDTESAYPALAFYHLRGLWRAAHKHLCGFRDELVEQQSDRERKKDVMEFNQSRSTQLAALSDDIAAAKLEVDHWRDTVQRQQAEYEALGGPLAYFSRKRLEPELEVSRGHHAAARQRIEALFDQRIKLESTTWQAANELSCEGKRVINLAVLALAQHLFLHFSDNGLGEMARNTHLKSLKDMGFKAREDCEFIIHRVSTAVAAMRADRSFAEPLKLRAKHLRSVVRFRTDDDPVPVADSLGQVMPAVPGDSPGQGIAGVPLDVNVLMDDYWDVSEVLLR